MFVIKFKNNKSISYVSECNKGIVKQTSKLDLAKKFKSNVLARIEVRKIMSLNPTVYKDKDCKIEYSIVRFQSRRLSKPKQENNINDHPFKTIN